MARTEWKDRVVERPRTFTIENNVDGTVTLVPAPGQIIEAGTPVNAQNLNALGVEFDEHLAENATDHDIIRLAKFSTGTANALVIDTAGTFDLTKDGNVLHIVPNLTNTTASTIAVDGQTAKSIKKFNVDTDAFVDLEAGDLKKNTPAQIVRSVGSDFFILRPSGGGSNIKSVQRGVSVMPATTGGSSGSFVVNISEVDPTKTVVYHTFRGITTSGVYHMEVFPTVHADGVRILFQWASGGINLPEKTISWEAVEYNKATVQRGMSSVGSNMAKNITVNPVNMDKSFTISRVIGYSSPTVSKTQFTTSEHTLTLINPTTLRQERHSNTLVQLQVGWQLIELN